MIINPLKTKTTEVSIDATKMSDKQSVALILWLPIHLFNFLFERVDFFVQKMFWTKNQTQA